MTFKDRFNRFFSMDDDLDYYEEEREQVAGENTHEMTYKEEIRPSNPHKKDNQVNSKVLKINHENTRASIKILEPRVYSEVTQVAEFLLEGLIVVVNFQKTEDDQAKKMIDFLAGAIYAIRGDMQKVGEGLFVCAPASVEIDGLTDSFSDLHHY